jgi:hypothetical protein
MEWLGTITIGGLVVLAALLWLFIRTRSQDKLTEMMAKRKASSKIVNRAEYVEGLERIPVAMALAENTLYYENPDLQASFDLVNVEEIEYDSDLSTGHALEHGRRVLRLRAHGRTFEFLMEPADSKQWESLLPQRREGGTAARAS